MEHFHTFVSLRHTYGEIQLGQLVNFIYFSRSYFAIPLQCVPQPIF